MTRTLLKSALAAAVVAAPLAVFTANHREAPITALDRAADITDWYIVRQLRRPVQADDDPVGGPAAGAVQRPQLLPLRSRILYEMKVDNDQDAVEDVILSSASRLSSGTRRLHRLRRRPARHPAHHRARSVPARRGSASRQTYTVTAMRGDQTLRPQRRPHALRRAQQRRARAPCPTTQALFDQGIYDLGNGHPRVRRHHRRPVLHRPRRGLRLAELPARGRRRRAERGRGCQQHRERRRPTTSPATTSTPSPSRCRSVPDPRTAHRTPTTEPAAVLGTYGTTSRPPSPCGGGRARATATSAPAFRQVQRMGNPLINELIIGTGSKDRFSMDYPTNDGQFAAFFARPLLADIFESIGMPVPTGARTDLAAAGARTSARRLPPRHARVRSPTCSASTPASRPRRRHSSSALAC